MTPSVLALALGAMGCAEPEPDGPSREEQTLVAQPELPAPKVRSVRMTGSGCTDADEVFLTGDRASIFADFSDYLVTVSPEVREGEAECTLSIALEGAEGVAYSPAGIDVDYITDSNSNVALIAGGRFTTPPSTRFTRQSRVSTRGRPGTSRVLDEPGLWSSCSGARELELTTKLSVRGAQGRSGFASIQSLSGLRFRTRSCEIPAGVSGGGAPGGPVIHGVALAGGKCREASDATAVLSPDRRSFSVEYDDFEARTGELGDCGARVELSAARGYRVAIASLTIEGSARLPAGSTGKVGVAWWRGGESLTLGPDRYQSVRYVGPRQGAFQARLAFAGDALTSGCDSARVELMVDAAAAGGDAESASIVVERLHSVELRVEPCR